MILEKIELIKAIKERKSKEEVENKFKTYFKAYNNMSILLERDIREHNNLFLDYVRYINSSSLNEKIKKI